MHTHVAKGIKCFKLFSKVKNTIFLIDYTWDPLEYLIRVL